MNQSDRIQHTVNDMNDTRVLLITKAELKGEIKDAEDEFNEHIRASLRTLAAVQIDFMRDHGFVKDADDELVAHRMR